MEKNLKKLTWALCVCLALSSLLLQNVSAGREKKVSLFGKWEEGARSVSSTIPITAYINDGVLSIHSSTQRSDITLSISKDGNVVYEGVVPASETSCIIIDLCDFGSGTYSVELKNQWGDYLNGIFKIEQEPLKLFSCY